MSKEITKWLEKLGLDKYVDVFVENDVDLDTLPELNEDDLKELGLSLGHRRALQKAIASLTEDGQALFDLSSIPSSKSIPDTSFAAWERHPGERKPVTMLFADIAGSTALTEKLDAEEAHELLYSATQRMCEAIERCRGTVCKLMGDGVMAMFGAPMASEHHAVDACEAALNMQHAIGDHTSNTKAKNVSGLRIRVGLHSGEVVVLTAGEGSKVEYDASGPTVPIAARMEQAADPGEVYITEATHTLAEDRIEADTLEPITVKGVYEPVKVYALRRVRPAEEAMPDSVRTPFVGRRSELNQFRGLLDTCIEEGNGQTVYIRGEPGIGKTRLIDEFTKIAEEKGVSTHRGLVLPFGAGKGQDAVRSLVGSLLGITPGGGKSERQRMADKALNEGLLDPDQAVFTNDLLGLPQPANLRALYNAMDNTTRNAGKQAVVSALVSTTSNSHPLLVIVEDVHWADTITMAHLSNSTKTVAQCPVLLVMTSRIEGDQLDRQWLSGTEGSPFFIIELGPLRTQDAITLISKFISSTDPLAERCLERAAGNPLFLEQLLRNVEAGAIESLPDSIQSLVLARVDRLQEEDKQALQSAAVIGQQFDLALLNNLLATTIYNCGELVKHNLVRVEGSSYLFTHALIQEGVYGSLLRRHRQSLHKKCAEYFAESDLVLCAEHLGYADDPEAGKAFLKAADYLAKEYKFERALSLAERGLSITVDEATQHRLRCLKGDIFHELDDVDASIATYQQVLDEANDELQRFDAWMGLAAGKRVTDDFDEALKLTEYAGQIAIRHHFTNQLAKLHHLRGNLYYGTGNIERCRSEHILALENARKTGSIEDEARALGGVADAESARGRMRSAYESFQLCIDRCRDIGLGRVEVANRSQMANCFVFLGQSQDVLSCSLDAVAAAFRVGHLRAEMNALSGICSAGLNTGDSELLGRYEKRGSVIASQLQSQAWQAFFLSFSAVAHYFSGDLTQARELAEKAVRIGEPARAFTGGWTLGALSLVTDSSDIRTKALQEGNELLAKGMNGEGHLYFIRYAMLACWQAGMWDELEHYADALVDFTSAEPLPWSDFFIASSRILARIGRGEQSDSISNDVTRLVSEGTSLGYTVSVNHLKAALG